MPAEAGMTTKRDFWIYPKGTSFGAPAEACSLHNRGGGDDKTIDIHL